jgi:AraC family transcriptional regulator
MNPQTEAIAAGLSFIEHHLCDPISVGDIADASGYSLFHFIRVFNKIVRHAPYDYLIRRRLSRASRLLLETDARVLEIGLSCQFDSHEGFTRAFGRLFGMPPTTWRDNQLPDRRCIMPAMRLEDLTFRQLPNLTLPNLIELDRYFLVGWMYFTKPEDYWEDSAQDLLIKTLSETPVPGAEKDLWKVRMLPTAQIGQEMVFLGVRVTETPYIADRYVMRMIEAGRYLYFSHKRLFDHREAALNFLYHTFLPKSGLRLSDCLEIEYYGDPPAIFLPVGQTTS